MRAASLHGAPNIICSMPSKQNQWFQRRGPHPEMDPQSTIVSKSSKQNQSNFLNACKQNQRFQRRVPTPKWTPRTQHFQCLPSRSNGPRGASTPRNGVPEHSFLNTFQPKSAKLVHPESRLGIKKPQSVPPLRARADF